MNPKLKMLCGLYDRSDKSIDVNSLLKVCFFENLEDVLNILFHKQKVKFAYLCAKSVLHLNNKEAKDKAEKCLELVEKWLENPNSVSHYELRKAAYASYDAAYATTANAAYATADAAYAAVNANSVCAANAAYAAVNANSAYSAAHATHAAKNKQEQEYKNLGFLVKVIKDE